MFQLGVLLFLSLAVSLSSGQDVTLSESSSSSGTCKITRCRPLRDSLGARVSCIVNVCFEAFNGSGNCFSSDLSDTPIQRVPRRSVIPSEPYVCKVKGDVCLCRTSNHTESDESYLGLLSFGFSVVLLFLPIIIFFNINLASGPNHSFVFFYQCVPLASVYVSPAALLVMQNYILPAQPRFILLEYCKYIVVLFVIFLVFFLVKCTSCPLQRCRLPWAKVRRTVRNFREKHIGSTFIHAICSIIVLSYGDLVAISMRVAHGLIYLNRSCSCYTDEIRNMTTVSCSNESSMVYYDWSSSSNDIVPLLTALVFVTLLLPLPLSLIYYPSIPTLFHKLTGRSLPRFPKLDPVFDVFQGVYKDKMRWFAGVHLLYLMILWTVFIVLPDVLPFIFVFILAIHSLLQPFKNPKHNYLETLYLVYLVLIFFANSSLQILSLSSTVSIFEPDLTSDSVNQRNNLFIAGIILTGCLISFPALLVFVYYSYNKLFSKCLCCQKCAAKMKNCYTKSVDKEEVEVEVQLKEYKEAQPEEEKQEDDHPYYVAEWSS